MPYTETATQDMALAVIKAATDFTVLSPEELARRDLGPLSYVELLPALKKMFPVVEVFRVPLAEPLPVKLAQDVLSAIGAVQPLLNEIKSFDYSQIQAQGQNPGNVHQNTLQRWDTTELVFWRDITPAVAFTTAWDLKAKPAAVERELAGMLADARLAKDAIGAEMKKIEEIVAAGRAASADLGVERHARLFGEEAIAHQGDAERWLLATGIVAGVTIAAIVGNLIWVAQYMPDLKTGAQLQLSLAKVLIVSMLISITVWCGRVYRVSRHNTIVNRHRQNALSSFETFVQAASDDQTKNAVLLHAAQCIFTPQASGFTASDAEGGSPNILELIRTVAPQSK